MNKANTVPWTFKMKKLSTAATKAYADWVDECSKMNANELKAFKYHLTAKNKLGLEPVSEVLMTAICLVESKMESDNSNPLSELLGD